MSDTPRTDSQAGWVLDSTPVHAQGFELDVNGSYVPANFARELERENARLRHSLVESIAQLKHVEKLRSTGCGPIPATLTPDVIEQAERLLTTRAL